MALFDGYANLPKYVNHLEGKTDGNPFTSTQFHIEPGKWIKDQIPFLSLERVSQREVEREEFSTAFASLRVKVAKRHIERAKERLERREFDCAMVCFSRRPQRVKNKNNDFRVM